jgi:hypothetical protein
MTPAGGYPAYPGYPGYPAAYPGYPGYPGYPAPGQSGALPGYNAAGPVAVGAPGKTVAMTPEQINAPLLSTGNVGENVAWLVPLEGPQIGELFQVNASKGVATIGSGGTCDFKILDAAISGMHAEIRIDGQNRFRIRDLGSTNGTYVNDKKIESIDLVDGDNIRLGRTTFRFKTKA